MANVETMVHPFSSIPCEIAHLQLGDVVNVGDVYRSATILEESGLGRWFSASHVIDGSVIGLDCNVHFMRLAPIPGAVAVIPASEED